MTRLDTGTKYGNRVVIVDGERFDSAGEYARWRELRLLERAGELTDLRRQVPYELVPALHRPGHRTEPALRYVADFVYQEGDRMIAEDFKGYDGESTWRLKRRLFLWLHPDVELRITTNGRR